MFGVKDQLRFTNYRNHWLQALNDKRCVALARKRCSDTHILSSVNLWISFENILWKVSKNEKLTLNSLGWVPNTASIPITSIRVLLNLPRSQHLIQMKKNHIKFLICNFKNHLKSHVNILSKSTNRRCGHLPPLFQYLPLKNRLKTQVFYAWIANKTWSSHQSDIENRGI